MYIHVEFDEAAMEIAKMELQINRSLKDKLKMCDERIASETDPIKKENLITIREMIVNAINNMK